MDIRAATANDIPAILDLFRQSLGEEGGIPEHAFWRWKHEHNPFGVSPTLLAFSDHTLVGLRTFMRWRYVHAGAPLAAYRAVDTATHPAHQGRGIFKKLTLQAVKALEQGEPTFIFNTPNDKSKPGYLKMGWQELGKPPLYVQPRPLSFLYRAPKNDAAAPGSTNWNETQFAPVLARLCARMKDMHRELILTDYSPDFLRWRYRDIPGFSYQCMVEEAGQEACALFFRIKQTGGLREMRIADVLVTSKQSRRLLRHLLKKACAAFHPNVLTILPGPRGGIAPLLPFGFVPATRRALTVTIRQVNDRELFDLAANLNNWFFASGALELF